MRGGRHEEALQAYAEGADLLGLMADKEAANILLSGRLAEATRTLRRDLHANSAAAALKLGEWEAAIECSSAALRAEASHAKARYRRACAYVGRGKTRDYALAIADLEALLAAQPANGAASALLREAREAAVACGEGKGEEGLPDNGDS